MGVAAMALLFYLGFRRLLYLKAIKGVSWELFKALKSELEESGVAGITEKDMVDKYLAMAPE